METDEKLSRFLKIVPSANWRHVPEVWGEQFRRALSDNLVKVGWGGWIELTESGRSFGQYGDGK